MLIFPATQYILVDCASVYESVAHQWALPTQEIRFEILIEFFYFFSNI